jgi:hypothetical protein
MCYSIVSRKLFLEQEGATMQAFVALPVFKDGDDMPDEDPIGGGS